jgi:hypothetical protein
MIRSSLLSWVVFLGLPAIAHQVGAAALFQDAVKAPRDFAFYGLADVIRSFQP